MSSDEPRTYAYRLACSRILFYTGLFYFTYKANFGFYSAAPIEVWNTPGSFKLFGLSIASESTMQTLGFIWKTSVIFSALGFLSRPFMMICFLLGFYLFGIEEGFIATNFAFRFWCGAMGVFAFSRAGDILSLDYLIKKKLFKTQFVPQSESYQIALQWGQMVSLCPFFVAGLAKIRDSGLSWPSQLSIYFKYSDEAFVARSGVARQIKQFLLSQPYLVTLMGWFVLTTELSSLFALWRTRARPYIILALVIFCMANYYLMYINRIKFLIILLVFWIPWEKFKPRKS